jgi:hypothetical protein
MKLPKKFRDRIAARFKQLQAVASLQRDRDVSEADTVTVVKDVFAELFGYDKYAELTSEQQVRGTFCDLAVRLDGKIRLLVEVKSAGTSLNESHLRQALNYGANQGIEWVVLTNAVVWQLHKIGFNQPISSELVASFSLEDLNPNKEDDLQLMFLLSREGFLVNAMGAFHERSLLVNRYIVAQIMSSEIVASLIRRELRKLFEDVKIDAIQIQDMIANEVLKRDVVEGEKAKDAQVRIKKAASRLARLETKEKLPEPIGQETA